MSKKIDPRFQNLEEPAKLKGRCPVDSQEMKNVNIDGTHFFVCGDHYKVVAVDFEKMWQDFLKSQGDADALIKALLDSNQAENKTPASLLKVNLYGPQ